jgi:hypothetical protein
MRRQPFILSIAAGAPERLVAAVLLAALLWLAVAWAVA